jgi:hypothetical protein
LVFAKAFPVVRQVDGWIERAGNFTRTGYDLRSKIKGNIDKLGISINVKFDVLNRSLLDYVGEFGCRLLHLSSDIFDPDKLCIEGDFGICETYTREEFMKLFGGRKF